LKTEFAGKRALVTGRTKGMGKAIAARLLQAGAKVMTTAREKPEQIGAETFVEADASTMDCGTKTSSDLLWRVRLDRELLPLTLKQGSGDPVRTARIAGRNG
jgi:NAD(P)-dependent dehydrogenase (short-subunit alcohol dehydrogenase family)